MRKSNRIRPSGCQAVANPALWSNRLAISDLEAGPIPLSCCRQQSPPCSSKKKPQQGRRSVRSPPQHAAHLQRSRQQHIERNNPRFRESSDSRYEISFFSGKFSSSLLKENGLCCGVICISAFGAPTGGGCMQQALTASGGKNKKLSPHEHVQECNLRNKQIAATATRLEPRQWPKDAAMPDVQQRTISQTVSLQATSGFKMAKRPSTRHTWQWRKGPETKTVTSSHELIVYSHGGMASTTSDMCDVTCAAVAALLRKSVHHSPLWHAHGYDRTGLAWSNVSAETKIYISEWITAWCLKDKCFLVSENFTHNMSTWHRDATNSLSN